MMCLDLKLVGVEPRSNIKKTVNYVGNDLGVMLGKAMIYEQGTPIHCPFEVATAACDAFYTGCEEGHRVWRRYADSLDNSTGEGA